MDRLTPVSRQAGGRNTDANDAGDGGTRCERPPDDAEIGGALPVNTDGGVLAMGHPFGASGVRMLNETVTQLRGAAGAREVSRARRPGAVLGRRRRL